MTWYPTRAVRSSWPEPRWRPATLRPRPDRCAASAPVKIGIIGSGRQGGAIGLLWAKAGHEVFFSSRNPENLKELVAQAGPKARPGCRPRRRRSARSS